MGSGTSGKGSSSSKTNANSTTNSTTTNNVDNRVYQSDFGAVSAAFDSNNNAISSVTDISADAISLGRAGLDAGTENLNRGLGFASDAYTSSLGFGRDITSDAIDAVADSATRTTDALKYSQDNAFNFGSGVVNGLFDFAGSALDRFADNAQDLAAQSIAGNQSLAKATSESADDRVTRLGMYAFGALAVILVLPAIFGKK